MKSHLAALARAHHDDTQARSLDDKPRGVRHVLSHLRQRKNPARAAASAMPFEIDAERMALMIAEPLGQFTVIADMAPGAGHEQQRPMRVRGMPLGDVDADAGALDVVVRIRRGLMLHGTITPRRRCAAW